MAQRERNLGFRKLSLNNGQEDNPTLAEDKLLADFAAIDAVLRPIIAEEMRT